MPHNTPRIPEIPTNIIKFALRQLFVNRDPTIGMLQDGFIFDLSNKHQMYELGECVEAWAIQQISEQLCRRILGGAGYIETALEVAGLMRLESDSDCNIPRGQAPLGWRLTSSFKVPDWMLDTFLDQWDDYQFYLRHLPGRSHRAPVQHWLPDARLQVMQDNIRLGRPDWNENIDLRQRRYHDIAIFHGINEFCRVNIIWELVQALDEKIKQMKEKRAEDPNDKRGCTDKLAYLDILINIHCLPPYGTPVCILTQDTDENWAKEIKYCDSIW
jgi:hypothetical protein